MLISNCTDQSSAERDIHLCTCGRPGAAAEDQRIVCYVGYGSDATWHGSCESTLHFFGVTVAPTHILTICMVHYGAFCVAGAS